MTTGTSAADYPPPRWPPPAAAGDNGGVPSPSLPPGADPSSNRPGQNPAAAPATLAASEYPTSDQAFHRDDPSAPLCTPDTLRANSLHRWTLATRTIAHYVRLEQIGEGTYGQVYRASCFTPTLAHPRGGEMVALKKIRLHHPGYWGIPPTVVREIKILKKLQHRNLVKMFEVVSSKGVEELDGEDEREDDRRKKEAKEASGHVTPNSDDHTDSALIKSGGASNNAGKEAKTKKRKKDPMSDMEKLRESYKGNLFLVLEYVSHDLTGLLDMAYKFTEVQVKSIIQQLLEVLEYMHSMNYVHRDLKSSNILITDRFEVKLADFGLARCLDTTAVVVGDRSAVKSNVEYTNKVITLWYRPPELLLGETRYGPAVDLWSAGCILAEIILGRPIFTGKTDMDQLKLIFDLIGTPTERTWEGFHDLKLIRTGEVSIEKRKRPKLREKYGERIHPPAALSLLEKLLELDPSRRCTANRALAHRYFQVDPLAPRDPRTMGKIDIGDGDGAGFHEFQTKKRRRGAKAAAKEAENEAKRVGMTSEQQKEAFDEAYRRFLTSGGGASSSEGKQEPRQGRGRP